MQNAQSFPVRGLIGTLLITSCLGCMNANNTQKGALLGGAGGAGIGAIIGHQFGATGTGALIGGLAGTAGGALVGNSKDEANKRDAAARHAAYERSRLEMEAHALTNRDVADMVANGVSDSTIVTAMRDKGGRFDTSPQAIIALHNAGVSDGVVQAMQHYNTQR